MSNKKYNAYWFDSGFTKHINHLKYKDVKFLEIGSFEGLSTNFFLEYFLTSDNATITVIDPWIKYSESTVANISGLDNLINDNTYDLFLQNTEKYKDKIIKYKGFSKDVLPTLKQEYDFIFIDGDHSTEAVLQDAIDSFKLLKVNGIMAFDDYEWEWDNTSPKPAINQFISDYADKIEVLEKNYQLTLKKISD
jgi:predicted O-methyltransferase YrrM